MEFAMSSTASPKRRAASAREAIAAGDRDFISSLARGLAVLNAFSEKQRRLSIADVSHRTGIPRAAVRRSLHTLAELGYVAADDARRYHLRPKVLSLGYTFLTSTPLVSVAQTVLDRLSQEVHESCSLAILDDQEIVYLARSTSSKIMSVILNVGRRLPAYCTSIGQVLLANLDEDARERYLAAVKFLPFTDRTITTPDKLRKLLAHVRDVDYAVVDRQMEGRLVTIGVPVRDKFGTVVAGMNVIVTAGRIPLGEMTPRFLPALQSAASELGALVVP